MGEPAVGVRRVVDPPGPEDGWRVLVDRLWPRGLRKEDAQFDEWCKEVAPSAELRNWYGHRRDLFGEFTRRYERELQDAERSAALHRLGQLAGREHVTLLTATHDVALSHAQVLATMLTGRMA